KGERALVPHLAREKLSRHHPVLVTVRLRAGLSSLRGAGELDVLYAAFQGCTSSADRLGLRLVHFTIQSNHVHFLVEARDARSLARGMQGLLVRIARGLNRLWHRRGPVLADRYHSHVLKTPRE